VARENKLNDRKETSQKPISELLETIVEDVVDTASMLDKDWLALSEGPFTQLAIPVGSDRHYRATRKGIDAAWEIAQQVWGAHEEFRQSLSHEEFDRLSFKAIGEMLKDLRTHFSKDAQGDTTACVDPPLFSALEDDYNKKLVRLVEAAHVDLDQHIPCHLFHTDQRVPVFSIGPVTFRPRANWIDDFIKDPLECGHIRRVEKGEQEFSDLREQATAQGSALDLRNAWSILSYLRGFEWVATIRLTGHALGRSHQKAATIVGLAIDALGLTFRAADSRRFTKAGRQHLYSEDRLASLVNGRFLHGSSTQMPGLGAKPGALASHVSTERAFLFAAGQILQEYVKCRQTGRAPHLVERWANALYWFGEARREASDFMAVVDYGCAADGLSGAGGKAAKMTDFAEAAINPKGESTQEGFQSIADAVTQVYREGRNQLAHGETYGLLEDMVRTRAVGDALVVGLFRAVTPVLADVIANRREILNLDEKHAYRALQGRLRN